MCVRIGLLLGFYGSDGVVDFGSGEVGLEGSFEEMFGDAVEVVGEAVDVPIGKGGGDGKVQDPQEVIDAEVPLHLRFLLIVVRLLAAGTVYAL